MYYVYPVHGNGVWQRNVAALKKRADLFNGNRIVAVAQQEGEVNPKPEGVQRPPHTVDNYKTVCEALGPEYDIFPVPNHTALGEVPAFQELLKRCVTTYDPGHYTFYAHAKGVTRPFNEQVSVHPWSALMYACNLDYWPIVESALTPYSFVGALKKQTHPFVLKRIAVRERGTLVYRRVFEKSRWHYSGTFFWFKNSAMVGTSYTVLDQIWGGVEFWPGKHWPETQGYCLFGQHAGSAYDWNCMRPLLQQFRRWSDSNARHRRPDASPVPWQEYCGYPL